VHDALPRVVQVVQPDAELAAIRPQRLDLLPGDGIFDRQRAVGGGDVVVEGSNGPLWSADLSAGGAKPLEGLRAGHLVDQLQVDVEERPSCFGIHDVIVPDLLEHRPRDVFRGHRISGRLGWAGLSPTGQWESTRAVPHVLPLTA